MKATYNSAGQMVAEKWFDKDGNLTAHYKYVYDGKGNIVRSIDFLSKKCYNYEYEGDNLVRATESDIEIHGEVITDKVVVNTVKYYYDSEGKQTKKVINPANGTAQTIYYENTDDNTVVKFIAGGRTVTSHSKNDSFGRKSFDELQIGTGFVSRQFHYHSGEVTEEHKDAAKLKSSATTQLVSQIVLSSGRIISYEYDAEERITKVIDSVDGTTEYTYDALGQLLTEVHNGTTVNTMTYDDYGNILSKNGIAYSYGNAVWKDLLTGYGDQTISYDAQGNPTSYLGHTLTWEKGRQLKSFDGNTYTYNANGIRTSKVVDGLEHTYTLEGNKIVQENWGNNTLRPLYDAEDAVCGIVFDGVPYYFKKNFQGDIIEIVNSDGKTVVRYSYDAWGLCEILEDTSKCSVSSINPYRYRSYYIDTETGLYYLQSRYYNPIVGRFLNSDDANMAGDNLFAYCSNSPVANKDSVGYFGTPVQWVCAVIGGVCGWSFGDYIARGLGLAPKGKGWWNATRYWAVRAGVVVGGAVIGWFAGTTIINLAKQFLIKQPTLILTVINKLGTSALAVAIISQMIKAALYSAGCVVLSYKKCPVAKDAWHQALYGNGRSWSSSTLNNKIKNSTHFTGKLKSALSGKTSVTNKKISLNFTNSINTDLYLSIGRIDLYVTGTKRNGKWNLTVKGTDRYNFDEFRLTTGFSVGNVANDVGLVMQQAKLLKPYDIKVSFTMTY